jgi:esterase/lipase superfamily enzyme
MNREYLKHHSRVLGRDMETLVFGDSGVPIIVFPTSMGRFYDYEDRGMIDAVRSDYQSGHIQAFCIDSVDSESWYNKAAHPADRSRRHDDYDRHIVEEFIPYIRSRNSCPMLVTTGCSFGGYHTINFALRHPGLVTHAISMGGAFDIHQFLGGYYDDNCYFNCPPDFLPNLNDAWQLDNIRSVKWVLATGEHDICLEENRRLSRIMDEKAVPHYLDVWQSGTGHDWPWWQQMAVKFLGPLRP